MFLSWPSNHATPAPADHSYVADALVRTGPRQTTGLRWKRNPERRCEVFNGYQLKRGVEYSFRITVWNHVYVDAYGRQQSPTLTVRAGDNFRHEVFAQTSH